MVPEVPMKRKGILITLILIALVAVIGAVTVSTMKAKKEAVQVVPTDSVITTTPVPSLGTSDADLDTAVTGIDTKLKSLNTDTSITDGLNDQQGNLSEQ